MHAPPRLALRRLKRSFADKIRVRRTRVLMQDGRWLLEAGEPVPELAPPPEPEKPAILRQMSKTLDDTRRRMRRWQKRLEAKRR
jgi:hypothetical protein